MTDTPQNKPYSIPLNPPDLSKLMSEILCKGGQGQRLVFVEYDPATRALYDHMGTPENSNIELEDEIDAASSWESFLEQLMNKSLVSFKKSEDKELKQLMEGFPQKIAKRAKDLLKHLYGLDIELLDQFLLHRLEERKTPERFLVCLARSHGGEKNEKAADYKWLENNKIDIEAHLRWLLQQVPQFRESGGSGRKDAYDWAPVDNSPGEIKDFIDVAGLEFIFGMRQPKDKIHSRSNLYLDTGEYAGQVIAFADSFETDGDQKELDKSAIEAAGLLRRILPEVRQARYVDAILSGQSADVLDHALVRYLPYMISLDRFYVKIVNNKFKNWKTFFDGKAEIYLHTPAGKLEFFQHFEPQRWKKPEDKSWSTIIKKRLMQYGTCSELKGFIDYENDPIIFTFFTENADSAKNWIAVVAVLDKTVLSKGFFDRSGAYYSDPKLSKELKEYPIERRKQVFTTCLQTNLAVLLQPRHPLCIRLDRAKEEGKSYEEQYGTSIYGPGYLDLKNLETSDMEERYGNAAKEVNRILRHVKHTKERLVGTLYQPRGYRAIARIIFDEFFCPLWRYFEFVGNPAKQDVKGNDYTPLGSLVREALDFEDTLRLEGGYREHFVHSYHVFLLGLHLIRKLHLCKKLFKKDRLDEEKKAIMQRIKAWFLTSMYHDIGYPIEKMETIAVQYLQRLRTGEHDSLDGDLAIGVNIGFEKLLASGLLSTRLRYITDCFVKSLFPDNTKDFDCPPTRKAQLTQLERYLCKTYHKKMTLMEYKKGLGHTFFQFCMHLALIHGEHGIISSLLFDGGARRYKLVDDVTDDENKTMRETVSVAILSHHVFDNDGKWSIGENGVPVQWAFLASQNGFDTGGCKEIAQSIGWDPAFFIYDLQEKNDFRFLSALLILCDVLAQWGRTDETRQQLIYLRRREDTDPLVILCYPEIDTDDNPNACRGYYADQIVSITGPAIGDEGCNVSKNLVTLPYGCKDLKKGETAERCDKCIHNEPKAEGDDPLVLTPKPKDFEGIKAIHARKWRDFQKKQNEKNKKLRKTRKR